MNHIISILYFLALGNFGYYISTIPQYTCCTLEIYPAVFSPIARFHIIELNISRAIYVDPNEITWEEPISCCMVNSSLILHCEWLRFEYVLLFSCLLWLSLCARCIAGK